MPALLSAVTATKHLRSDSFAPWRRLRQIDLPFRCAKRTKDGYDNG